MLTHWAKWPALSPSPYRTGGGADAEPVPATVDAGISAHAATAAHDKNSRRALRSVRVMSVTRASSKAQRKAS